MNILIYKVLKMLQWLGTITCSCFEYAVYNCMVQFVDSFNQGGFNLGLLTINKF